ncbi:hypothetical protein CTA2_10916, partial [Colletotrichum tanaceti]
FNVAVVELIRFYQFFVGLPVSERNWSFERPVVDEL